MKINRLIAFAVLAGAFFTTNLSAEPKEIKGEAILKHPVGAVVLKAAELMKAGKIDEAMLLRTAEEQADWKASSDRELMAKLMQQRAPEPKAFKAAIIKSGLLTVRDEKAEFKADMGAEGVVLAYLQLEEAKWKTISGPIVIGPEPETNETRVDGAQILDHPIANVAVAYADLVHAGQMEKAMKLSSTTAEAKWKALPADEKKEDLAFRKKLIPPGKDLRAAIESGGILFLEETRATLNLVVTEQKSTEPGVVSSSSTTVAIPFVMEDGDWKVAQ